MPPVGNRPRSLRHPSLRPSCSRLHLAAVLASAPNILILDEPTNDLDLSTVEVLEEFLQKVSRKP